MLLSPSGAPDGYFIDLNYVAPHGVTLDLPKSDTLWKADGDRLTETTPVTLTFDNGKGLVIKRKISVDEHYMFTVVDTVENRGKEPLSCSPTPPTTRPGAAEDLGLRRAARGLHRRGRRGPELDRTDLCRIAKETNKAKVLPVDSYAKGGWLGFTDKYWATAIIPDARRELQGLVPRIRRRSSRNISRTPSARRRSSRPAQTLTLSTRVFAGAKE